MIRVHGKVQPLKYSALTPTATREMIYDILSNEQRQRLENDWELALLAFCPALPTSA